MKQARDRAARAGVLAFSRELSQLRSHGAVASVTRKELKRSRKATSQASQASKVERALLTRRARRTSAGIDTARLSRDTGSTRLAAGHETVRLSSPLATAPPEEASASRAAARSREGGLPRRSIEAIQRIFDRNKGKLYALYNRALRRDPTLRGKLVLRLTIDAGGRVTACEIVSSELNHPTLEQRLVARIKLFDFGAMEVLATTVTLSHRIPARLSWADWLGGLPLRGGKVLFDGLALGLEQGAPRLPDALAIGPHRCGFVLGPFLHEPLPLGGGQLLQGIEGGTQGLARFLHFVDVQAIAHDEDEEE